MGCWGRSSIGTPARTETPKKQNKCLELIGMRTWEGNMDDVGADLPQAREHIRRQPKAQQQRRGLVEGQRHAKHPHHLPQQVIRAVGTASLMRGRDCVVSWGWLYRKTKLAGLSKQCNLSSTRFRTSGSGQGATLPH